MLYNSAVPDQPRVANPPAKPVMIFDGNCGFCRCWIERWRRVTRDEVDYAPSQDTTVTAKFPEVRPAAYEQSVLLIDRDGHVYEGAHAVFRSLATNPKRRWLLALYRSAPGFARASEASYKLIAANRTVFSAITKLILPEQPVEYALARSLFIRLLGLIYLIAFVSLWVQVIGLIGSNGIIPIERLMGAASDQLHGPSRFTQLPTLCWISTSDLSLHIQCGAGAVLAAVLIAGLAPAPVLFLLWAIYLSLTTASGVFLSFQWDNLLLETGLLAVLFAPIAWQLRATHEPSRLPLWLLRWLLFRLMFQSGWVKLLSGDKSWGDLEALRYHYETQPLPTWIGWHAHNAPAWLHSTCTVLMFAIELVIPFLIFCPRKLRLLACWIFVPFQLSIAFTGNYGFFNLLTIVLCLTLLDDRAVRRMFAFVKRSGAPSAPANVSRARWPIWIHGPAAVLIFLLSLVPLVNMFVPRFEWPVVMRQLITWQLPFRSVNHYGLFSVMTVKRPEILIEGTSDGQTWLPYKFKYKPDDRGERPRFVAPHQPRLDWQMWFAALGTYQQNPWFANLCLRLLQGSPEVLDLFENNPFPGKPPRYVRAVLYEYKFTGPRSENWWQREQIGYYSPVLGLEQ